MQHFSALQYPPCLSCKHPLSNKLPDIKTIQIVFVETNKQTKLRFETNLQNQESFDKRGQIWPTALEAEDDDRVEDRGRAETGDKVLAWDR